MDIIDDIFASVSKATGFVTKTAVDTKEFVKLEYKLSAVKNELASKLTALGKITYKQETMGVSDDEKKAYYIGQIKELTDKLSELMSQMEKYKKVCKDCGKTQSAKASFCSGCGKEL